MARAKRTDRAEARRRYRQNQLVDEALPNELGADGTAAIALPRKPATPARPTQPQRVGMAGAFRLAAAPADVRADLRALPRLLRTRAALVPAVLIVATFIGTFAFGAQQSIVVALMFQAFLAPPPMAAAFLAGILADRGSWLLGLLAGVLAGALFAVVMLVAPDDVILGLFRANTAIPAGFRGAYAMQALAISPLMGLATGAFAGFYRRFLRIASPQQQRSGGRSANRARKAPTKR